MQIEIDYPWVGRYWGPNRCAVCGKHGTSWQTLVCATIQHGMRIKAKIRFCQDHIREPGYQVERLYKEANWSIIFPLI